METFKLQKRMWYFNFKNNNINTNNNPLSSNSAPCHLS